MRLRDLPAEVRSLQLIHDLAKGDDEMGGIDPSTEQPGRPVHPDFIQAMEEGLEHGREKGWTWWDAPPEDAEPGMVMGSLVNELKKHYDNLEITLKEWYRGRGKVKVIREKAGNLANLAMMIADATGSLGYFPGEKDKPQVEPPTSASNSMGAKEDPASTGGGKVQEDTTPGTEGG